VCELTFITIRHSALLTVTSGALAATTTTYVHTHMQLPPRHLASDTTHDRRLFHFAPWPNEPLGLLREAFARHATLPELLDSVGAIPLRLGESARRPPPKWYCGVSPCDLQDSNASDSSFCNVGNQNTKPSGARRTNSSF